MTPRPKKLQMLRWLPNGWVTTTVAVPRAQTQPRLYLTFDDGPHPEHTPALLTLLAAHDAKATFFVIGKHAERYPELVRDILAGGHALANHSWSHPIFDKLSLAEQLEEIARTDRLLTSFDGKRHHDFRPPRGVLPRGMVMDSIRCGRRIAYWSYDSLDYSMRPATELIDSAKRHPLRGGDILLLHDDNMLSRELLDTMLPVWSAAGFTFDALPQRD